MSTIYTLIEEARRDPSGIAQARNPSNGGITVQDNIASWSDCERMRIRAMQVDKVYAESRIVGSCTQIRKVVVLPDAPTVKFTPPQITVMPAPVTVQPAQITIKRD